MSRIKERSARSWLDAMPDGFARLAALHPKKIDLSLDRMARVLAALGHPERSLPPVIHVAGTNGKGSVIAFLRALAEAEGKKAHIYTSPHLIRFSERIIVAGREISDDLFIQKAAQVEEANQGLPLTFFEAMTAAAFLAFCEKKADICLLETGLGGRLDATNMIARPAMTIITSISFDHQAFLGERLTQIAREKAGIIKPKTPLILAAQEKEVFETIASHAAELASPVFYQGRDWRGFENGQGGDGFTYQDKNIKWNLPLPALRGEHQIANASCAIAAMRFLRRPLSRHLAADAMQKVKWAARLQKLPAESFNAPLPLGTEIFLDGGHNPQAGGILAGFLKQQKERNDRDLFLICAMRATKNMANFIKAFQKIIDALYAVPLPLYAHVPGEGAGAYEPSAMAALAGDFGIAADAAFNVSDALKKISGKENIRKNPPLILIAGSLLLAGDVLAQIESSG